MIIYAIIYGNSIINTQRKNLYTERKVSLLVKFCLILFVDYLNQKISVFKIQQKSNHLSQKFVFKKLLIEKKN